MHGIKSNKNKTLTNMGIFVYSSIYNDSIQTLLATERRVAVNREFPFSL